MQILSPDSRPLGLTNDGFLSIIPVGCGSAFGRRLGQNNYLLVKGSEHLMIDCGTGTPSRLNNLGLSVTDIRNYFLTHSHADHIGGLEEVMLLGRYVAGRKPLAFITEEYEEILWHQSLKGGAAYNERHDGTHLGFQDFWEVRRPEPYDTDNRDMRVFDVGTLNVKIFRTNHFPKQAESWRSAVYSVGAVLDDRILFTGDTKYDPNLLHEMEERFDIEAIFHDVQFFTGGVHASIEELAELPQPMLRKTYLMHYGDTWESQLNRIRELGFAGLVQEYHYYDFH